MLLELVKLLARVLLLAGLYIRPLNFVGLDSHHRPGFLESPRVSLH